MDAAAAALTTTAVQITIPVAGRRYVMLQGVGDAAWLFSNASGGTYLSIAANA
jgi:hypothetical protein